MTKTCTRCSEPKSLQEFYVRRSAKDGRASYCKDCDRSYQRDYAAQNREKKRKRNREWRANNPDKARENYHRFKARHPERVRASIRANTLKGRYGLTPETWEALLASQQYACAACGSDKPGAANWHTDHCHQTGKVRGILCRNCNVALGHLRDSPERILALYAYITKP